MVIQQKYLNVDDVLEDCFQRVEVTWDNIGEISQPNSLWTEVELVQALRNMIIKHGVGYGLTILAWRPSKAN